MDTGDGTAIGSAAGEDSVAESSFVDSEKGQGGATTIPSKNLDEDEALASKVIDITTASSPATMRWLPHADAGAFGVIERGGAVTCS